MPVLERQKPLYKHDCEDCIYLGSDEIRDYYCCIEHSMSDSGSLIIRLGNQPSDYFSMPVNVMQEALESSNFIDEENVFFNCYNRYLEYLGKSKTL